MLSRQGPAPLLSLPVELIQRIATFCPCSALLNLLRVNRRLHAACNDRLVFEQVAKHDHVLRGISSEPWCPEKLFDRASLSDTARIAYAVEKAGQWATNQVPATDLDPLASTADEWLPHLLALHHPASFQADGASLLRLLLELQVILPLSAHARNVEYCFASRLLAARPNPVVFSKGGVFYSLVDERGAGERTFGLILSERMGMHPIHSFTLPEFVSPQFPMAVIICLSVAVLQDGSLPSALLPQPRTMHFQSLLDIPRILRNTSETFATCHRPHMTGAEFLASGEWVGVFNDLQWTGPGGQQYGLRNLPMHAMRFRCETLNPPRGGVKTHIIESSGASDDFGSFTIAGNIYENGMVKLTKTYPQLGWLWDWRGYITPLGIAGLWGSAGSHVGGFFWIWKLDWCER